LTLAFVLASAVRAPAHEAQLRGLVLGVLPASGEVVLRYDAFLALPAATTTFKLEPASLARRLKAGERISGTADADEHPWVLRNVSVLGKEDILGDSAPGAATAGTLRNVEHLETGSLVPATSFSDQDGRPFSLRDLNGQRAVMAFIYTRCRDARMCPLISAKFAQLQEKLRGDDVRLVEVTLDPVYDRPAVLKSYGKEFGADASRWTLATGDPEQVLDFAAQFDVTAFPDPRVGLIHAERTVLIDRYGVIRQLIDETAWTPDELVAQLRSDERRSSNPFARFNLWLSAKAVAICGNSVAGFSGVGDLLVVAAIFGFFAFLMWRIARSIARSAT
jgi:protein SCO1/2